MFLPERWQSRSKRGPGMLVNELMSSFQSIWRPKEVLQQIASRCLMVMPYTTGARLTCHLLHQVCRQLLLGHQLIGHPSTRQTWMLVQATAVSPCSTLIRLDGRASHDLRSGSTAKALAKCKHTCYRISECLTSHWTGGRFQSGQGPGCCRSPPPQWTAGGCCPGTSHMAPSPAANSASTQPFSTAAQAAHQLMLQQTGNEPPCCLASQSISREPAANSASTQPFSTAAQAAHQLMLQQTGNGPPCCLSSQSISREPAANSASTQPFSTAAQAAHQLMLQQAGNGPPCCLFSQSMSREPEGDV